MAEESPIKIVGDALFKNKKDWFNISDETKGLALFVFNQRLSRYYPKQAQLLNNKNINKASAMDAWFYHLKDVRYIPTLWSKSDGKKKEKEVISKKDKEFLRIKLDLHEDDLDFLITNHLDEILDELKWYKEQQKNMK
jgi:hypothetical protein